jgi:hypothetical protein
VVTCKSEATYTGDGDRHRAMSRRNPGSTRAGALRERCEVFSKPVASGTGGWLPDDPLPPAKDLIGTEQRDRSADCSATTSDDRLYTQRVTEPVPHYAWRRAIRT